MGTPGARPPTRDWPPSAPATRHRIVLSHDRVSCKHNSGSVDDDNDSAADGAEQRPCRRRSRCGGLRCPDNSGHPGLRSRPASRLRCGRSRGAPIADNGAEARCANDSRCLCRRTSRPSVRTAPPGGLKRGASRSSYRESDRARHVACLPRSGHQRAGIGGRSGWLDATRWPSGARRRCTALEN